MAGPTVYVRCPTCRGDLRVVLAPAPPTQWFPCPHCRAPVAVVVPRDPPPLYTWEVLPGLYPALPAPRIGRRRRVSGVTVALLVVAVTTAALAGLLVFDAWQAVQPGTFGVSGAVESTASGFPQPLAGATVTLTNDANRSTTVVTGPDGSFSFNSVPPGGVTLNVSAPGFASRSVSTFVSSVYAGPTSGIVVELSPGVPTNVTSVALADFPDLEQFVAALGAGAVLLGVVTIVAGAAAVVSARADRPAVGVIGGAAGLLSPFAVVYLSLSSVDLAVSAGTAAVAAIGAFVVAWRAIQMAQTGPAAN
jgi:Carboxypeptidase regulatory-like domain